MRRLLMLVALCGLLLPFSGCGDDDKDKNEPESVQTDDAKDAREIPPATLPCDAEVSTTGAYEATWEGEAIVRTGGKQAGASGPDAVYQLIDNDNRVALYSPGPEFNGAISLSVGKVSYASDPAEAESFSIDKHGRQASVDTTLTSIAGDQLGLKATFTCGKDKGK